MNTCEHTDRKLVKREYTNGVSHYVYQCQKCGRAVSSAIKKEKALELNGGEDPPPFNTVIYPKNFTDSVKDYSEYLLTEKWRDLRRRVLERSGGMCEGCREHSATEIHHLTYKRTGREMLFDLVALCTNCHSILHRG